MRQKRKSLLNIYSTLVMFALIPTITSILLITVVLITTSTKEVKDLSRKYMVSLVSESGISFDHYVTTSEQNLLNFTESSIVREYLKNPEDEKLAKQAQAYTVDYFGKMEDWEGIYIADWNSKVLTHPSEAVVGKVMREGDRLKELQNSMLNEKDGLYNVGIIKSPASPTGEMIISMYAPVYDDDGTPLGYVGAGVYIRTIVDKFEDVKELGYDSAYAYVVKSDGTMIYHPDEEKIGQPVENAGVLGLVEEIQNGNHPDPVCLEYTYKGVKKYGACYVSSNDDYISIITANQSDILEHLNRIVLVTILIALTLITIFVIAAFVIAGIIAKPIKSIAATTEVLAGGNITGARITAKSRVKELISLIGSADELKSNLGSTVSNVKESINSLSSAISDVNQKVGSNNETITQINLAMDEVAHTSQYVAESASDLAEKASDLGADIDELDENVNSLHRASMEIQDANDGATKCMNNVLESSNRSVEAVNKIVAEIEKTNEAVGEIEQCVEIINDILSQTKLLALNASIEAARAGEAGLGFAVVAQSIQQLAESSSLNVEKITVIIDNVTALSKNTTDATEDVKNQINKEMKYIQEAQEKFENLSESVKSSLSEIEDISEKTNSLEDIKNHFMTSASDLCAVSEELGATSEEVAASCQEVADACAETIEHTEKMTAINDVLKDSIEFFN